MWGRRAFGHTTFVVFSGSMPALREADYRGALDVLREAGDVEGAIPFPEPVLEALRRLVPCDVVAYHERLDGDAERTIVWTGEPRGQVTPAVHAAGKRYWHQDPMTPVDGARKYSDFFSRREFQRLELYQEVARPVGVEYMMRLWLSPHGEREARLEFDRAGRDFGERDRAVLDLLLPHLGQFGRSAVRRRARPRLAEGGRSAHGARAADRRSRCPGQDECRDRLAAWDLTGDRSEAPRERLREARSSYAYRSGGCTVRARARHLVRSPQGA
jgi:hypothetical protein